MNKLSKKKHFAALFLILSVAFFMRLYFFLKDDFITTDGAIYALSGKNLMENGRYELFGQPELMFPPGYPIAIGAVNYVFHDLYFSAKLISLLFGFLSVYLFYLAGVQLGGKKTGLLASFFSALSWPLILVSSHTSTESMYVFFALLSVYLYLRIIKNHENRFLVVLGLSIGISYLIRPEGIILLALIPFFILQRKKMGVKNALKGAIMIFVPFFIIFASYVGFIYRHTGELSYSLKANTNYIVSIIFEGNEMRSITLDQYNLYEKVFSHYDEKSKIIKLPEEYENISLLKSIENNPVSFLILVWRGFLAEMKILMLEFKAIVLLVPIAMLLVSAILFKRLAIVCKVLELMFFPILFLAIFPIFHVEARYLLQPLIFMILIASFGLSLNEKTLGLKAEQFRNLNITVLRNMGLGVILTLALFNVSDLVLLGRGLGHSDVPAEQKAAAEFIKKDFGPEYRKSVIMSRKPFAAFYSGSEKTVGVPYSNMQNVLEFAKANKVNYIVIDERFLGIRDNYKELENLDKYSDKVILGFQDNSKLPIKVFKILP